MIREKELVTLATYLDSLGLVDKKKFLQDALDESLDGMVSTYNKRFGTELMTYRIFVNKDAEQKIFDVLGLSATLTRVGQIPHNVFEGINTAKLEQRMTRIDWNRDLKEITANNTEASLVFNDVIFLTQLYNKKANWTAQELMIKYWAGTPIEKSVPITDDRFIYQQNFSCELNNDYNDLDAAKAYNILSGRAVLQFAKAGSQWRPSHWLLMENQKLVQRPLFNLAACIRELPFARPLNDFLGQEFIAALCDGGTFELMLQIQGKEILARIQADPIAGRLAIYNAAMNPIELKAQKTQLKPKSKRPPI